MSAHGIGERLIEAREARGLSLEDAERDTRIAGRYLEALEAEQFEVIPASVYARGFLRSYAQYLGLDAAQLLDLYPQQPPGGGILTPPSGATPTPAPPARRGSSTLFRSKLPDEPMIGVDIGVAVPPRRTGAALPFARLGIIVSVAVAVTAGVVVLALVIANTGGGGGATPLATPPPAATPTPEATPATSGIAVQRGVVPDVIGLPEDVARRAVEEAGYNVTIVHGRSEEYPRGTVFEQAPSAGVELEPGRAVFIAVSEGP